MDPCQTKVYHKHGFDSKVFLETYFSGKSTSVFGDDILKFPIQKIHEACVSGDIKGDLLIDISAGPILHYLYPICGLFKEITLLRFSERCMIELRKWRNRHTGAFEWSHISPTVIELLGDSKEWDLKDMHLKSIIKQIVKCHSDRENLTDPLQLPQADCVIISWILELTSTDEGEYMSHLKKMVKFVKPGGHLIIFGALNGTYYTVGKDRMHMFKQDESFVRNAVVKEGFTVTKCDVLLRNSESHLTDYQGKFCMVARKDM
ncbi:nicotinamide N-methyltransferase-like [Hyperolius riggenbachi]|uniref:nicotinamide N-methyltransferase-like n=1 Tax=Hyperolius riggenbachi TaxID=752182 RepID=UPI0035A2E1EA